MRTVAVLAAAPLLTSMLAACASPVETIAASAEPIDLRWYKYDADFDQAEDVVRAS